MRKQLIFLYLILGSLAAKGQEAQYLDLLKTERELNGMFEGLYSENVTGRDSLLDLIGEKMQEALARDGAMEYPWTGLEKIGVVTSEDNQVRVFTWHIMDDPDSYRYYGYIQVARRRRGPEVYLLEDNMKGQRSTQNAEQSIENWYGKLYYGIVTNDHRRQVYYTLLGLDFNDRYSNIKTIETIALQRNRPEFERNGFFNGRDHIDRVILEYSSQVSMITRYDPTMDLIAFDHLAPFHPIYEGNYEFYGPDGSFDGYEFEDGIWILREDLDARNY